ncbi:MAG: hypothetical protein OEZ41_03490 [Nitrospirota bacterium]|nr:hypothetical protein [Nitrospirota bacterium]MDH5699006.1 hypothetical protein [Nitrospirota bacterium]
MNTNHSFTAGELALLADQDFFRKKAAISVKIKQVLESLHHRLEAEIASQPLLAPEGFDPQARQFVKGEHLEDFPYQYVDFPRFYTRENKLAFRSLFWWGHHMVFALMVEGSLVKQYRRNLFNRYSEVADHHLCLCLSPSLWEWKAGPGLTLPITHDRRSAIAATLDHRTFFKIARFLPIDDPAIETGTIVDEGLKAFQAILPIITI